MNSAFVLFKSICMHTLRRQSGRSCDNALRMIWQNEDWYLAEKYLGTYACLCMFAELFDRSFVRRDDGLAYIHVLLVCIISYVQLITTSTYVCLDLGLLKRISVHPLDFPRHI